MSVFLAIVLVVQALVPQANAEGNTAIDASPLALDAAALLEFKMSVTADGGRLASWNGTDPCLDEWAGIICDEAGTRVEVIELYNFQLEGTIDSAALRRLTALKKLEIGSNQFTGTMPDVGGALNLEDYWVYNNKFTGQMPESIGRMPNLVRAYVGINSLTGTLPPFGGPGMDLPNLRNLHIDNNKIGGPIPSEWGNLTNLRYMPCYGNRLNGQIPSEIGRLTKLIKFEAYDNLFSGSIPSEFGRMRDLERLDLFFNELTGTIPPELGKLTAVLQIMLYNNKLTGSIPTDIGSLSSLRYLHVQNNDLTSTLPPDLAGLSSLVSLRLEHNKITGNIPAALGTSLVNLESLYLASNQLSSTIPPEIGSLSKLAHLHLQDNSLTGAIPKELGLAQSLEVLDLSNNDLTLTIPPELATLQPKAINLRSNLLTGPIPEAFCLLVNRSAPVFAFESLDVSKNGGLCGPAPLCFDGTLSTSDVVGTHISMLDGSNSPSGSCDTTPPTCDSAVGCKLDTPAIITSLYGFNYTFTSFDDAESGVASYRWGLGTIAGEDDAIAMSGVDLETSLVGTDGGRSVYQVECQPKGLDLINGMRYYITLVGTNAAGPALSTAKVSSTILVDATPPEPMRVFFSLGNCEEELDELTSLSSLRTCWDPFVEPETNVTEYFVRVVDRAKEDVLPWVSTGTLTMMDADNLALKENTDYFIEVRSINTPGLSSLGRSLGVRSGLVVGKTGYWRKDDTMAEFVQCMANRCEGEQVPYAGPGCREGHTGVLCGECKSGFAMAGLLCASCDDEGNTIGVVFALSFVLIIFIWGALLFGYYPYFRYRLRVQQMKDETVVSEVTPESLETGTESTGDKEAQAGTSTESTAGKEGQAGTSTESTGDKDDEEGGGAKFKKKQRRMSDKIARQEKRRMSGVMFDERASEAVMIATDAQIGSAWGQAVSARTSRQTYTDNMTFEAVRSYMVRNGVDIFNMSNADPLGILSGLGDFIQVLVSHMQMLRIVLLNLSADWGPASEILLQLTNIFMFDMFKIPGLNCALSELDFYNAYTITLISPLVVAVLCGLTYIWLSRKKTDDEKMLLYSCSCKLFVFLCYVTYIPLSAKMLSVYSCKKVYGAHYLASDLSVQCFTPKHNLFMILGIVGILLVPIGVPLLYFAMTWQYKLRALYKRKRNAVLITRALQRYTLRQMDAPDMVKPERLNTETSQALYKALKARKLRKQNDVKARASQQQGMKLIRPSYFTELGQSPFESSHEFMRASSMGEQEEAWNKSTEESSATDPEEVTTEILGAMCEFEPALTVQLDSDIKWTVYSGVDVDDLDHHENLEVDAITTVGFIFAAFKPHIYWFETFECFRKLLLTVVIMFMSPGTTGQILVTMILAVMTLIAYIALEPFKSPFLHQLKVGFGGIFAVTVFVGLYINVGAASGDSEFIEVLLIVMNIVLAFVPMLLGASLILHKVISNYIKKFRKKKSRSGGKVNDHDNDGDADVEIDDISGE